MRPRYWIDLQDIFITPIFLLIIIGIMLAVRSQVRDTVIRPYFLPAFGVKLVGAIALGLIYQFYYRGGDTYNFFREAGVVWQAFTEAPGLALRIIFAEVPNYSPDLYLYTSRMYFFSHGDSATYNVIRLAAFFSIISFHTYTTIAVLFAVVSFTGMWAMFRAFYDMYPALHRPLAVAVFFVPSVFFWGSGLMKDTLTLGALGWTFYSFYFGLIKGRNVLVNVGILLVSIFIIRAIKVYIISIFLPAMLLWLFLQYRTKIRSALVRAIALPFLIAVALPFAYLAFVQITADNERYKLENLAATAEVTADWLKTMSEIDRGSGYSLGQSDFSPAGMAAVFPQAIWLGLFQPHPWQAGFNPVMLLAALEASFFLYITLRILFTTNLFRLYSIFFQHPVLLFCLLFCVVFAGGVALASSNYGTMVRYRIPLQPFYLSMLYIIRYQLNNSTKLF
ncbi:MAG: hypothetical protein OHK0053_25550 [Microscillaceae bacterium]